jgi:hypothetical protein
MQAAQAKAAQEKAASTSDWNASKATNEQLVVDAIEIDDDISCKGEISLTKARKSLLEYYAQPQNFLAFQVIDILFGGNSSGDNSSGGNSEDKEKDKVEDLKTVFSITQGNPNFAAKLTSKHTGVVPDCVTATQSVLTNLTSLHYSWASPDKVAADLIAEQNRGDSAILQKKVNVMSARDRFREKLDAKMISYLDVTISYFKHMNKDIMDANKTFNPENAESWRIKELNTYNTVTADKVLNVVYESVRLVDQAEGLVKTKECLQGLILSQVFDVNKKPKIIDNDNKLLVHIGGRAHRNENDLCEQWRQYVDEWRQPATLSPMEVYAYWESKTDEWNILAPHAMRMFSRPVSSAACERVFIKLSGMDDSDRSNMNAGRTSFSFEEIQKLCGLF